MAIYHALRDPLVADAVLFEGGAFEAFLTERGVLLPHDERLLGDQWLLAERSIFEVEGVRVGTGFTVRDLRTGDRVDVRDRAASQSLKIGMLICARVVPAGDTVQCFGGIEPVGLHQRDDLIRLLDGKPGPIELIELLSRRFAPPVLQNTEGDPLVLCEATLRSPDPATLIQRLDQSYERADDHPTQGQAWYEHVVTQGVRRIRASLFLDGDTVRVDANSVERFDRVLNALSAMQPGLALIEEARRPADDVREAMSRAPIGQSPTTLDPDDPDVADALRAMIRQYEQAWLDQSIPALDGATPRQAAADPTRRPDLVRLLDSFPAPGPGTMDPDRIRAELGL